jgi:hypothetical protein
VEQAHEQLQERQAEREREAREARPADAALQRDETAPAPEREGQEAQAEEPTPQPVQQEAERAEAPRAAPEPAHERDERDADTHAAREESGGLRVFDRENGLESSVSAFAGKALDYIATQAEGLIEGIAEGFVSLFDGGSAAPRVPKPEPARAQKSALQRLQERAAKERALRNISQSVKRGDDLNAADLRVLPRGELERLRDGGDEYLMRMVQRYERERDDRGRERER